MLGSVDLPMVDFTTRGLWRPETTEGDFNFGHKGGVGREEGTLGHSESESEGAFSSDSEYKKI